MQMTISGHHLDVTDPIRDYVTAKLSKLERHYDHINSTAVILSVENFPKKLRRQSMSLAVNYSPMQSMRIYTPLLMPLAIN